MTNNPAHDLLAKTLITGSDGMVGNYIDFGVRTNHRSLDITNLSNVMSVCTEHMPRVIIHLAAATDLTRCEQDPAYAYAVNSVGTYNLALAARRIGAKLVYVSTFAVFDGTKKEPYTETDNTLHPVNIYGHSKYLGELAVRGILQDFLLVRASWIFGGGKDKDVKFVGKILRQLDNAEIKAVTDKYGSPTYAKDLVAGIRQLIVENKKGLYNLGNVGSATRYEIANEIKLIAGAQTKIVPATSADFSLAYPSGTNEGMVSKIHMRSWQEALKEYIHQEWQPSTPSYQHNTACRICAGTDLVKVLDLGSMPPANAYVKKEDLKKPETSFPLVLYFCRTCSLAQLLDVVNQDILFKDYHFLTSASDPSIEHFRRYADEVIRPLISSPDDLVIDIGGNDGILLSFVKDHARVLNVDPADNLASISEGNGVPFYPAFFTSKTADDIIAKYGKVKVVVANNVFAHTDPLKDVFKGIAKLISEDGTFIFEVHWAKHFVEEGAFDQIYHEHLCFHSLHALKHLVESSGMNVFDVQIVPMQGRSLRVFAAKDRTPTPNVERVLSEEKTAGLTDEATYHAFAQKVETNKDKLLMLLRELKAAGKKIAGYGAPAKGNTLLNYYGIGPDILDYLTDTTTLKHGLYSPGMHIPIVSPERLLTDTPDYILLLAWNFKDAILEKEKVLRAKGVKFINTVPQVEVLS